MLEGYEGGRGGGEMMTARLLTDCSNTLRNVQGPFTWKTGFFFYRAFIANTEIIKLSLFNIVPC